MKVIECMGVTKKFGNAKVLNNLSFEVRENKITGLIGRNGAGKTTLLKIVSGFIRENDGEVNVFGAHPFNNLFVSANSILIDDQMMFPPSLTLIEILKEAKRFYSNWDGVLAERLLEYFSLPPNKYHANLSKGAKSTFNMIVGLSSRCALTLLDEPTTGMDTETRQDFYRAMLKDYIAYPRSIIISSHHLDEVENLLEDVLLIEDGKVLLHTAISELKEWAIGLQGDKRAVSGWTMGREVYQEREAGMNQMFAAVRNEFTKEDIESARAEGLEVTALPASEVCVLLTKKGKGEIDDVFS